MNAKLYKTEKENYVLVDPTKGTYDDGYTLGTSRESQYNKLSIKNCQTIELGYDLDELLDNITPNNGTTGNISERIGFVKGFQKALELMGDKKFSINEVVELCKILISNPFEKSGKTYQQLTDSYIKSLQQTEWDVLIDMEPYHDGEFIDDGKTHIIEPKWRPALDADGCLILKLKLK